MVVHAPELRFCTHYSARELRRQRGRSSQTGLYLGYSYDPKISKPEQELGAGRVPCAAAEADAIAFGHRHDLTIKVYF